MTNSHSFVIERANERQAQVIEAACVAIREWAAHADLQVTLADIKRTPHQNAALWPALRDFSVQVPWAINGQRQRLDPEDWKDILTAAYTLEVRMAPALTGGGFVMLGVRTSRMGKREMGQFLSFVKSEGDSRGVRWSAPARERFDEFMPRGGK